MTKKIAVVMDALEQIKPAKDSTLALMLEMQQRGWQLHILQPHGLYWHGDSTWLHSQPVLDLSDPTINTPLVSPGTSHSPAYTPGISTEMPPWYRLADATSCPAQEFDAILMRKDPPFDMDYIYTTYLLDAAEHAGVLIQNRPASIRAANEKIYTTRFPQCMPVTIITSNPSRIREFVSKQQQAIIKPLHGMGGYSIFRLNADDANLNVIIETVTAGAKQLVMVQAFIPDIMHSGDKRIIMIDGQPASHALARIPAPDDFRGNLASGATSKAVPLTERDRWLCQQVGPTLKEQGLWLVGLDVIGDYITEINVTSPTCLRELQQLAGLQLARQCIDNLERKLSTKH